MRGAAWYPYPPSAPPYGDFVAGQRLVMMPPPPMYSNTVGYAMPMPPQPPTPLPGMPGRPYELRPSWSTSAVSPVPVTAPALALAPSRPPEPLVPPPKRTPPPEMLRIVTFPHPADEAKTLFNHFSVSMGSPELEHRAVELEQQLHVHSARIKTDLDTRVEAHKDAVSLVLGGTTTKTSKTLCLMTLRCLAGARVYQMDFLHGRKKTAKNCAFFFVRGPDDYHNIVWYKHRIRLIGDAVYIALHKELATATQALKDLEIPKSDTRSTGLELAGHPVDIMLASAGSGNKDLSAERPSQDAPISNATPERETDSPELLPQWSAELAAFTACSNSAQREAFGESKPSAPSTSESGPLKLGITPCGEQTPSIASDLASSPATADFWVGIAESVLKEGRAPRKDVADSTPRDIDPLQCCRLAIELNPDSDYGLLWRVTRQALEFSHEPSLTITVNGNPKVLSLKDCVVKEILADDGEPAPWFYLYALLGDNESVNIHGNKFSRSQCLVRACQLDLLPLEGDSKNVYVTRLNDSDRRVVDKCASDSGVGVGVLVDEGADKPWGL